MGDGRLTARQFGVLSGIGRRLDGSSADLSIEALRKHRGLLGSLVGADFNSTADQEIVLTALGSSALRYRIRRIVVVGATVSMTTAAGGFYTAVAKGGNALVAATQPYTALTSAIKTLDLTLTNEAENAQMVASIYFSLTTAQGAPATADIYVYGDAL